MKGYLADIVPFLKRVHLPVSRDRAYLWLVVLNGLLLGLETFLAHNLNGNIRVREWVPIIAGPVMGVLLIIAIIINARHPRLALGLAVFAALSSITVGVLGTWYHYVRAIRPLAAAGERVSLALLVWGAPVLAPPAFVLVGLVSLVALCGDAAETTAGLGRLLFKQLPITKERLYFLLASIGASIALVSSVFDHIRGGFENPWLWVPTISGIFAVVAALMLGVLRQPGRGDLMIYASAMVIMCIVGPLGLVLHVLHDLGPGFTIVWERFLRGAPVMAPMVFANFGLLGLLVLLDPLPELR